MKLYKMVDGELVAASAEDVKNLKLALYDEEGQVVREAKAEEPDVVKEEEDDAVTKLSDTLTDLVSRFTERTEHQSAIIENQQKELDEQKKRLDDMSDQAQKAFPFGSPVQVDGSSEVKSFINKHYDLDRQGKMFKHPTVPGAYHLNEGDKALDEIKQYFTLVAIASKTNTFEGMMAVDLLRKMHGDVSAQYKTAIGDSGNVFPVPDIVDDEIFAFAREASVMLRFARVFEMTSEKQSFPAETAGASVAWGNTTAAGDPTVGEVELDAEELSGYSTVKNSTLADARSDVVSWIGASLAEAAGQELDNKGFNGVGTDDPFICSGILSAAAGSSVVMGSGDTDFSDVAATDLNSMIKALPGIKKQGARFWMSGEILFSVRGLEDTNGRPIFYDGAYGGPTPPSIFGYPYEEVISMPTTSAANTAFAAFGNLRYMAVGRRLGATALNVDPYGLFTTNRTRYKLYQRWGMSMSLPGGFVRLLTAAT